MAEQVKGVSITATTVKELKATIDELRGSIIQLNKADSEYDGKVQELQAHQAKLNEVMSLTSKATMAQVKAIGAVENSYDALVAKGAKLREQWRALEIGTAEWHRLATAINENEERLKQADAQIGRYQRNVGNYVGAISPLTFQINQLVREMPSLTVSANQFFLAISNNLPMFADEISKLRKANEDLVAQGKPTVNILSQIVKGVFSWQTALVVLITIITQFGGKVVEWVKTLGKAKVSIDDLVKSLNGFATSIETERRELDALFNTLKKAENGTFAYATARKQIEDKYGKYLENQNTEIRSLSDLAGAYDVLKGKIEAVSIAKALENQRTEAIKEYQTAIDKAFAKIGEDFENKFGRELGTQYLTSLRIGLNSGIPELETEAKRIVELFDGNNVGEGFYRVNRAVRVSNEAFAILNDKLRGINSTATQMGDILGVTANDVEEARKTIVDTSGAISKVTSTTDEAQRIAKATAQAVRELREEYKETESELQEFAKSYLQALEDERKGIEGNIRAVQTEQTERLRYAELAVGTEEQKAQNIYNIQQQALINEMALLQQGLDNAIFVGEERIKAEERVAQIQRDIAYNTAEYQQKVDDAQTAKKVANQKTAVSVAIASTNAISSILGSVADMYEQEGEANEEATKKAKNLRIAGATMDMLGGLVSAWTSALNPANAGLTIWGQIAMATLTSATILASGIANIQKIRNTDTSGNSSGVSASVSAPSIVQQVPVTRTLTGVAEEERLNQAQRVYVVYDDIAQVGRKVDVTESEATF